MADNKNIGIKNLPQVEEVKAGDFLLVEADDGTSIIDFQDFVLGGDNTTHGFQISGLQTDITGLSSSIDTLSANTLRSGDTVADLTVTALTAANLSATKIHVPNTVVQIVYEKNNVQHSFTTDASVETSISAAITPNYKSSKILGQIVVNGILISGAAGGGFDVGRHDVTNNTFTYIVSGYDDGTGSLDLYTGANHYYSPYVITFEDTIPAGSTQLRYILSADERDSSTMIINNSNGTGTGIKHSFAILNEIAQ
jgi:hypothetical protein|tara:strand:- start:2218 stop:2979 length:762 start_codon:yes stop_codon:yes gene_type:complete